MRSDLRKELHWTDAIEIGAQHTRVFTREMAVYKGVGEVTMCTCLAVTWEIVEVHDKFHDFER